MNRNTSTEALVLGVRQTGENNRLVSLLTPREGIISAMLFGGSKSRLKSLVCTYHTGTVWLYSDRVKNSVKITDFDVHSFRSGLRDSLYRAWAAAFCIELLAKTHCGGDEGSYQKAFYLANGFLDGLNLSSDRECLRGTLRFLWRYQEVLGLQINLQECNFCGTMADSGSFVYSAIDNALICSSCIAKQEGTAISDTLFALSAPALRYLDAILTCTPAQVRSMPLDGQTENELKQFLFFLTSRLTEGKMKTLQAFQRLDG